MKTFTILPLFAIAIALVSADKVKLDSSSVVYDDDLNGEASERRQDSYLPAEPELSRKPVHENVEIDQLTPAATTIPMTGLAAAPMGVKMMGRAPHNEIFLGRSVLGGMLMNFPADPSMQMGKPARPEGMMFRGLDAIPPPLDSMRMDKPMGIAAGADAFAMPPQQQQGPSSAMFGGRAMSDQPMNMDGPQGQAPMGNPEQFEMGKPPGSDAMFSGRAAVPPPLDSMSINKPMGMAEGPNAFEMQPQQQGPDPSAFGGRAMPPSGPMGQPAQPGQMPMGGPAAFDMGKPRGQNEMFRGAADSMAAPPNPMIPFNAPPGAPNQMRGPPGAMGRSFGPADMDMKMKGPADNMQQFEAPEGRGFGMRDSASPDAMMKMGKRQIRQNEMGPMGRAMGPPSDGRPMGMSAAPGQGPEGRMMGTGGPQRGPAPEGPQGRMMGPRGEGGPAPGGPQGRMMDPGGPQGRMMGPGGEGGPASEGPEGRMMGPGGPQGETMPFNAISTVHRIRYVDVPVSSDMQQPATIEIGAKEIPINIVFKSTSSRLNVFQKHDNKGEGDVQETFSEDSPHRLVHTVSKPVYQTVREVIVPHRKVTQEIHPLKEQIETVIARGVEQGGDPNAPPPGPEGETGGGPQMGMAGQGRPSGRPPGQGPMPMGPGGPEGPPKTMRQPARPMGPPSGPMGGQPRPDPSQMEGMERPPTAGMGGGTPVERDGMAARQFDSSPEVDRMEKMELLKRLERLEKLLAMATSAGTGKSAFGGMRMNDLGGFAPRMSGMKGFKINSWSRARAKKK